MTGGTEMEKEDKPCDVRGAGGTKEGMRGGEEKETVTRRNQTQGEGHQGQRGFT